MTLDLAKFRNLAAAATPGPWGVNGHDVVQLTDGGQGYPLNYYPDSKDVALGQCGMCGDADTGILRPSDEQYIAALSPDVCVQMLDEIERLRKEVEASDIRMAGVLDGTFSVGDGTAQAELVRLRALVSEDGEQILEWKRSHAELCTEVMGLRAEVERIERNNQIAQDLEVKRVTLIDRLADRSCAAETERDSARDLAEIRGREIQRLTRDLNYEKQCRGEKIEAAQDETAESIASWIDSRAQLLRAEGNSYAEAFTSVAEAVRAGNWKEHGAWSHEHDRRRVRGRLRGVHVAVRGEEDEVISVLDKATTPSRVGLLDIEVDGATACACGHRLIPARVDGVIWYWQEHRRDRCLLELPDLVCWCGLKRSEHTDGHKR